MSGDIEQTMIDNISKRNDIKLPQRTRVNSKGELEEGKPMSKSEIGVYLQNLLGKDPAVFLERYGRFLSSNELSFFEKSNSMCSQSSNSLSSDYEVNWYVKQYQAKLVETEGESAHRHKTLIRNRRYKQMEQLVAEGEYFSEESMRIRNPELYYQYIAKNRGDEEPKLAPFNEKESLAERLLRNNDISEAQDRIDIARETEEEFEDDTSDEEEEEEDVMQESDMEEFRAVMKQRYMDGLDTEFTDYTEVDENSALDDMQEINREAEEKYFDAD